MARRAVIFSTLLVGLMMLLSIAPVGGHVPEKQKYIIFRDDDVGTGTETQVLRAVNQVHIDEGVPVTLGIVPHPYGSRSTQLRFDDKQTWIVQHDTRNQLYQDPAFFDYMRTISANPLFEFAQHGYSHRSNGLSTSPHDTSEFSGEAYSVQYETIQEGRNSIKAEFGITPTTFIPPWDRGDRNTLRAAQALGFTEYCTGHTEMKKLHGRVDGMRVEPADFDIYGSSFAELNHSITRAKGRVDQFFRNPYTDTFVVGYHFWTFSGPEHSADLKKVQLLRDFITYVKNHAHVSFTRLDRSVTMQGPVLPTTAETAVAPSSPELLARGLPVSQTSDVLNSSIAEIPLYALVAFGGLVLIGGSLYARRGRRAGARPRASSLTPAPKRRRAGNDADTAPTPASSWDLQMLRAYGVVIPADRGSQFLTQSKHHPSNDQVEPPVRDSTDL